MSTASTTFITVGSTVAASITLSANSHATKKRNAAHILAGPTQA